MKRSRNSAARLCGLLLAWLVTVCVAPSARAAEALPSDRGLPVAVDLGIAFVDLLGFDENAGTFRATVDLRLRWTDSRHADPDAAASAPPKSFTDQEAAARLAGMWVPPVILANQRGAAASASQALRLYPSGAVELIRRVTAEFEIDVDVGKFPFDRQRLQVEARIDGLPLSVVSLRFGQSDLDFSRPSRTVQMSGWSVGLVDLRNQPVAGWYSVPVAAVVAALEVKRQPGLLVASIFIPLLASLLIPLLAIWLNRIEDGFFQVDAFELVNIIIGGLFAVIALNFTIYSTFAVLTVGDNTVNRLFALNYVALAVALVINVGFGRFNVMARFFGPWVQEQTYHVLMWLVPALILVLAAAFLAMAYV